MQSRRQWVALAVILGFYLVTAMMVSVMTPPWEANDEDSHVQNVETLVDGDMYRIGEGLEAHQPPLYYATLAAWQRLVGVPAVTQFDRPANAAQSTGGGLYDHSTPTDGRDTRLVLMLRLVGIACGAGVLVLTFLTTRRVARHGLTPVVAAAVVASLPRFVFLSAVVNNDNLVNVLGAGFVFTGVYALTTTPRTRARVVLLASALGALAGLGVTTKLTGLGLAVPGLFVAFALGRRVGARAAPVATYLAAAVVPVLPWFVFTWRAYDDPLASTAAGNYFRSVIPGLMRDRVNAHVVLSELPRGLWRSFWYTSGGNQFLWPDSWYWPLWLVLVPALVVGAVALWRRDVPVAAFLVAGVVMSLAVFVYVGLITTQTQGRVMFIGLAAIAAVAAVGLERLPAAARFALPGMGVVGLLTAISSDVIGAYW